MNHTHTLAEWFAFLSLGLALWAAESAVIWLTADATLSDFDPRPAVRRVLESGRLDPLLVTVGPALVPVRETARDAAALFILLTTRPKGAMTA